MSPRPKMAKCMRTNVRLRKYSESLRIKKFHSLLFEELTEKIIYNLLTSSPYRIHYNRYVCSFAALHLSLSLTHTHREREEAMFGLFVRTFAFPSTQIILDLEIAFGRRRRCAAACSSGSFFFFSFSALFNFSALSFQKRYGYFNAMYIIF